MPEDVGEEIGSDFASLMRGPALVDDGKEKIWALRRRVSRAWSAGSGGKQHADARGAAFVGRWEVGHATAGLGLSKDPCLQTSCQDAVPGGSTVRAKEIHKDPLETANEFGG
jgi:hypothetical protein